MQAFLKTKSLQPFLCLHCTTGTRVSTVHTCGGLMTDDRATAESQSVRYPSVAKATSQKQQESRSQTGKILGTLLKGWRALTFLLITLIVGHYAFHYKGLSDPGSDSKQLANHATQEIDFFVSDPNISVNVTTKIQSFQSNFDNESMIMSVQVPPYVKKPTIIILTNSRSLIADPVFGYSSRLEAIPSRLAFSPREQQIIDGYYAIITHLSPDEHLTLPFFAGNDLEQTNAYLYGHLPAVGTIDQWVKSVSPWGLLPASFRPREVLAESYTKSPRIRDIVLVPKSPVTPYGGPGESFWSPAKLSITETQTNLAATIANQQVNYMTPTGQASGPNYTWQGSTYLEPVFQLTNGDALKSESDSAFLSGVLFGIAGAAAIAFVQEIPETFNRPVWWSRRKRKRESASQNPADEKPDSTEDEEQEVDAKPSSNTSKSSGLGWPSSD